MRLKTAALALLSVFLALPAFSQTTPKAPWHHEAEEVIFSAQVANSQATDHTAITADLSWAHFVSDRTEIGAVVTVLKGDVNGYAAGPTYEFNFPKLKYGNIYIGGDAQALTGDLLDAASLQAATRFGYKLYVGTSSALRIQANVTKAVSPAGADTGDPLNTVSLSLGFSMGIPQGTPVQ